MVRMLLRRGEAVVIPRNLAGGRSVPRSTIDVAYSESGMQAGDADVIMRQ